VTAFHHQRICAKSCFPEYREELVTGYHFMKVGVADDDLSVAIKGVVEQKSLDAFCNDIAGLYEDGLPDMDDTFVLRWIKYHPKCVVICFDRFAS
jgi:hypothetical protein